MTPLTVKMEGNVTTAICAVLLNRYGSTLLLKKVMESVMLWKETVFLIVSNTAIHSLYLHEKHEANLAFHLD